MKAYKYKIVSLLLLFVISVQAQKYDKKITEHFKVNSDVTVEINTSHTDVDIDTWNKNEVSIEAVIEVEGISEKEAEKLFKNWKFEALANKNKVKINSLSNYAFFEFDGAIHFEFPEMNFEIPHFELPELEEFPEFPELPDIEFEGFNFDYNAYKNDSTYLKKYKFKVKEQVEKFKNSDWEKRLDSVKNSDEYKKKIEEFKKATKELAIKANELRNSKEFKQSIEEAKKAAENARNEMFKNRRAFQEQAKLARAEALNVREELLKMKEEGKLETIRNSTENVYFNFKNEKNSTIKIKKYLKIKVPKNAIFDLNVKHGELTIPNSNTKMSSNISYGNFIGGVIEGSQNELKISNSSVLINTLQSGNISLKNVPNATFGTFKNANLFANSSDVVIKKAGENVALNQKFGTLEVLGIMPNFKNLTIVLDYAKGNLNLSKANFKYLVNGKKSSIIMDDKFTKSLKKDTQNISTIEGFFGAENTSNQLFLTGVFSTVNLN